MGNESMSQEAALEAAKQWLGGVEPGPVARHRDLTLVSLKRGATAGAEAEGAGRYVLVDEAVEDGRASIEEVSEGGSVPHLAVDNRAVEPILIPEGQILIGAKQNRTVNLTVLVAAETKFQLPVSCVEQGRWSYRERRFRTGSFSHPRLRQRKVKSAQRQRAASGHAVSDQGEVWASVEEHLDAVEAQAPTRDATEAFEATKPRLDEYKKKLRIADDACGVLAVSGGQVIGLDLFDAPATLVKLWPRLSDAYFVQAVADERARPRSVSVSDHTADRLAARATAQAFLKKVSQRLVPAAEQPGLGFEMELYGDDLAGVGVWHDGAICHLAAFAVEEGAVASE